jgi:thymidylate kinase
MAPYPGSRLVVLLDVPAEERERRIIDRDARWGTRVADRLEHLAITWRDASEVVSPQMVLDGTLPLEPLVARVVAAIRTIEAPGKEGKS